MSIVRCCECQAEWAATIQPCCPSCTLAAWLSNPNLITPKHHPHSRAQTHDDYRSIISQDLLEDIQPILEAAVSEGRWYYNTEYEKFNHVTRLPLQRKPGAGVHAGSTNPDRQLEDLVIADADQDPHLFADHREETRRKIATGVYRPLEPCSRAKCDNLRRPRSQKCALHIAHPVATSAS